MHALKSQIRTTSRLNNQAAFDSLRKTKIRWVAEGLALQAIPASNDPASSSMPLSFSIIASKKTAKRAVDRNLLRRRLRAVALEILPEKANQTMIYMVVARSGGLTRSYEDLKKDMIWCLKKLDLLKS